MASAHARTGRWLCAHGQAIVLAPDMGAARKTGFPWPRSQHQFFYRDMVGLGHAGSGSRHDLSCHDRGSHWGVATWDR